MSGGSGDVFSICHVTSQEHMIKESCDFTNRSSLEYVITLPCLVVIGIMVVGDDNDDVFNLSRGPS